MLGLEPAQLVEQGVVRVVADLGVVEDVIPVAVVLEEPPELVDTRGRICAGPLPRRRAHRSVSSSAAGAISRARS